MWIRFELAHLPSSSGPRVTQRAERKRQGCPLEVMQLGMLSLFLTHGEHTVERWALKFKILQNSYAKGYTCFRRI